MLIVDYSKIIKKKLLYINSFCIFIGIILNYGFHEPGLMLCTVLLGIIISIAICFTHLPSFWSKISIDEENQTFLLTKYPIAIPDSRAKCGFLYINKTINIPFCEITNFYETDNKIFFIMNDGQKFFISVDYLKNILSIQCLMAEIVKKIDLGKFVELTDADSYDETIIYSGKIVDVVYYKPYKRICTIVDTSGYINSSMQENRGNTLVLFNRYYGDTLTDDRIVNTYVPKNDVTISDEKECLDYSDFLVFCTMKYKKD